VSKAIKIRADKAIDSKNNWEMEIDGEKIVLVVESVLAVAFNQSLGELNKDGKLVLFGFSTGNNVDFNLREFS